MKTWQALVLTLAIFFVSLYLPPIFLIVVILGTSIWASVDSGSIQLHRYKSGIALKPFALFLGCLLLWIGAFPWYLSVRYRIKNGLAELKEGKAAGVSTGPLNKTRCPHAPGQARQE